MSKRKPVAQIFLFALVMTSFILLATPDTANAQSGSQQAALNASRSNVRSTFREGETPIEGVWVKLAKVSPSPGQVAGAWVTRSDDKGNFSFANVAPGEYVLIFSAVELKAQATNGPSTQQVDKLQGQLNDHSSRSSSEKTTASGTGNDILARITVTGAAGGTIEKDWSVKVQQDTSSSARLHRPVKIASESSVPSLRLNIAIQAGDSRQLKGQVSLLK